MDLIIFGLGILVPGIGYVLLNLFIKPYLDYRNTVFKVGSKLGYYSNIITSPGISEKLSNEATDILRELSFELQESYSKIRLVPNDENVSYVSGSLIFLSNSVHREGKTDENYKELQEIYTKLDIKELRNRYNLKK